MGRICPSCPVQEVCEFRETMSYERFIAIRHLQSRQRGFVSTITVIAILGVFLGVMALTSVIAVTGGFQDALQERVLGVNSHILVMEYGTNFRDYREVQDVVEEHDEVVASSPFIFHEMIADHGNHSAGLLVKGIEPSTAESVSDIPQYVEQEGALSKLHYDRFPEDGRRGVPTMLMGSTLADRLQIEPGDVVRVTSPLRGTESGGWASDNQTPSTAMFEVVGTYRSGFHDYDDRMVLTDYRALQDIFEQGDVVTGVDLRVHDVFSVDRTSQELQEMLTDQGQYRIMDWRQLNYNLFTSLELQRAVLAILFLFIVLVASFNIVCTLIMIVLEKNKDIAILKSMGATNWEVMKTFMYQGGIIGFVGTVNGLIGGLAVALLIRHTNFGLDPEVYMIDHLPVRIDPMEFGVVAVVAMVTCLVATVGPAWWASRMRPVDGLRYD